MLARSRGFSGSANQMVSVELCSNDPCCHGNENLLNFNKICNNFACRGDYVPNSCTKHRVFRVGEFNCANKICITLTPVAKVTKI